ncbi:hypothetical protein E2320_023008 [Naja naja]|nr:hypothetical protein E2320_023008 [Naja naja]
MQMAKMAIHTQFQEDKQKKRQSCRVVNTTATQFAISEAEAKCVDPGAIGILVGSRSVPTLAGIRTLIGRTQLYSFLIQDTQMRPVTAPPSLQKKAGKFVLVSAFGAPPGKLSLTALCYWGRFLCTKFHRFLNEGLLFFLLVFLPCFPPPPPPPPPPRWIAATKKGFSKERLFLGLLYLKMFNFLVSPIFLGTED